MVRTFRRQPPCQSSRQLQAVEKYGTEARKETRSLLSRPREGCLTKLQLGSTHRIQWKICKKVSSMKSRTMRRTASSSYLGMREL